MQKHNIVIVGGGFGGIYTYVSLMKYAQPSELHITIINKTNYFLFTPMLHEVATGSLSEDSVVESVRSIIYKSNTTLLVTEAQRVDLDTKTVYTAHGDVPFDFLVLAHGATTHFYNIPGAQEHSFVLKDLTEAIALRNHFVSSFELASSTESREDRKKILSFAIVGGGPTGVELVAEMADLFFETFRSYYKGDIRSDDVTLYLINRGPDLLSMFDESLRNESLKVLQKKGVKVLLNKDVKEITKNAVHFADGSSIQASHIIWTAGVKPNEMTFVQDVLKDQNGRIVVDQYNQMKGREDVFVLGDAASCIGVDGKPLPMLAQVAVRQALHLGRNIAIRIRGGTPIPFVFHSKGSFVSLGQWRAVGKALGILWKGPLAWWLWRTLYLFNFASWPKRLKIAIEWTINLFTPRDITKA